MLNSNFSLARISIWQYCIVCLLTLLATSAQAAKYTTIEWLDLLPKADLEALSNPPEALNTIVDGSAADKISSTIAQALEPQSDSAYHRALVSTKIRNEHNKKKIRIAGFVVPLEFDDNQVITEFFLVPFFGACIHVPPPPPNQIILGKMKKGIKLTDIYFPYWVEGTLYTDKLVKNDMATAAYQLQVDSLKEYKK